MLIFYPAIYHYEKKFNFYDSCNCKKINMGYIKVQTSVPVAQLDRASASGVEGLAFESRRAYHFFLLVLRVISSLASVAPAVTYLGMLPWSLLAKPEIPPQSFAKNGVLNFFVLWIALLASLPLVSYLGLLP